MSNQQEERGWVTAMFPYRTSRITEGRDENALYNAAAMLYHKVLHGEILPEHLMIFVRKHLGRRKMREIGEKHDALGRHRY